MHYSDSREPANKSKVHFSVPQITDFNSKENGGAKHDPSREHIQGPQAAKNEYKVRES